MSSQEALCAAAEVPEGGIRGASLPDGTRIALYKVDGRVFATADECTHAQASLSEEGTLTGKVVECGWHFGAFDVTTGEPCASPCMVPLKIFPISVNDGIVYVEV
jgi:p-cumate 2,3-dioxygenase ferredoxin subunit